MPSISSIFTEIGVDTTTAVILAPIVVGQSPAASEPNSGAIKSLVRGIQRVLNQKFEYSLAVDGKLGPKTNQALDETVGYGWFNRNWISTLNTLATSENLSHAPKIATKRKAPSKVLSVDPTLLQATVVPVNSSWMVYGAVGLGALYLLTKKKTKKGSRKR